MNTSLIALRAALLNLADVLAHSAEHNSPAGQQRIIQFLLAVRTVVDTLDMLEDDPVIAEVLSFLQDGRN